MSVPRAGAAPLRVPASASAPAPSQEVASTPLRERVSALEADDLTPSVLTPNTAQYLEDFEEEIDLDVLHEAEQLLVQHLLNSYTFSEEEALHVRIHLNEQFPYHQSPTDLDEHAQKAYGVFTATLRQFCTLSSNFDGAVSVAYLRFWALLKSWNLTEHYVHTCFRRILPCVLEELGRED